MRPEADTPNNATGGKYASNATGGKFANNVTGGKYAQ